ncbi:MAG: outer membrane beta-barrel protein, partial [Deferrisomatales bacterium]|nr:outer membrane beta-barrel protein [Deferrisomatales bacterium]
VRGTYDDNIGFSRADSTSDFVFKASPELALERTKERSRLEVGAGLDFVNHADESDLNRIQERYRGAGSYDLTERLTISAETGYMKDSTLESELERVGRVITLADRFRFQGGGGVEYSLNPRSDLGAEYKLSRTAFSAGDSVDYDGHEVALRYSVRTRNETDVYLVRPAYTRYGSDVSDVDSFALTLGMTRSFDETLSATAVGGARYSRVNQERGGTDRNWTGVVDLSVRYQGQTGSASLSYTRDLIYGSDGETLEQDRVQARLRKHLTERVAVGLVASAYRLRGGSGSQDLDGAHCDATPSVRYNMTRWNVLTLAYQYSYDRDQAVSGDEVATRNQVWIALNMTWPGDRNTRRDGN